MRRRGGDFFQHVVAFDQFAEGGVLAVEESWVAVADEKLGASRIGIIRARHGEHTAFVGAFVEFRFDLVAGAAGAPVIFLARIFCQRVAALDHETFDDAVKTGAVVKTFLGEGLEILDRLRGDVRPEFDDHVAFGGFDDGYFSDGSIAHIGIGADGGGVGFGVLSPARSECGEQAEGAE